MITEKLLIIVSSKYRKLDLKLLAEEMNRLFPEYDILSKEQQCAFIAQVAHESGGFRWLVELGSRSYFNKYEPGTRIGKRLGNIYKGDGYKFRGRGLIQLTGRYNVMRFGRWYLKEYGKTFEVEELSELPLCLISALWYWKEHGLQDVKDFKLLTRKINGGYNGLKDREDKYQKLLEAYS